MSRVPRQLKAGIVAVLALSGSGAGLYYLDQAATERTRDAHVQAVARDTTWATCYAIMADVQQGQRPMPTVEQVRAELPVLEWPA